MTESIATKLAENGILGILLVASCIVIYQLYNELKKSQAGRAAEVEAVQKLRIEDARAHNQQIVELTKTCVEAVTSNVGASQGQKEALGALRDVFEEYVKSRRSDR